MILFLFWWKRISLSDPNTFCEWWVGCLKQKQKNKHGTWVLNLEIMLLYL